MELQKFDEYSNLEDFLTENGFTELILESILSLIEKEDGRVNDVVIDGIRVNDRELASQQVFVEIWNELIETNIDDEMTHLSNYFYSLSYFLIVMIVKELKEREEEEK
jgi:hypothetical protein